jgi:cobalt transporter subunit CbtB
MATQTISTAATDSIIGSRRLTAGVGAMLMGTALLFLVGFAPMPAVHNAAHDTRHSAAFPCH